MSNDDNVHSKACIASAMISAVENFRDNTEVTEADLLTANVGEEAGMYLLTMGVDVCKCHVFPIAQVKEAYQLWNADWAKRDAKKWLDADRITLMDYTKLMGWLDRAERSEWTGEPIA